MIKSIIAWCIKNRFLVIFFTLVFAVWGIWAMKTTPIDAIPDLSDVQVIVYAQWMGQDPETIEDQVTYPLSTKMLAVPMAKVVRGYSFFGFSLVYIIFEDGTDIYWARSRVLEYLSGISGQLPKGVDLSLGPDATGVGWVFQYTLEDESGQYDLGDLRALQDWYLKFQLTAVSGVAEVASIGGYERQYQVIVDPNKLLSYNIPLKKVIMTIKQGNKDVGGRLMELSEIEYMIRGKGYVKKVSDLEDLVVGVDKNGTPILIRNIATVQIGPDIRRGVAEKDGQGQVVGGIIVMRFGENALEVIEGVKKKLAELQKGLPEGVVIKTVYDRSNLIHRSIDTLKHELGYEMIIVAIICIVFLWHFRSALVAWAVLPLGILGSLIIMRYMGLNANIMSLGGIAIAVGAMIDASVVLVENTHKHFEHTPPNKSNRWQIVTEASQEVGPGLFFSLLVITVSFLPIFVLGEQSGRLFKPLAYTKTFAMAVSALIAITVTPVLIGFLVRGKLVPEKKNPLSRFLIWIYVPALTLILKHRKKAIIIAVVILAATYIPISKLGSEFMPPLNEGDILYMPTSVPGISVTAAQQMLQTQDKLFKQFPEVDVVFGKVGRAETPTDPAPLTMVETTVTLKPPDTWPERKIVKGFLADIAYRVLRQQNGTLFEKQTKPALKEIAQEAENMSLGSLNTDIRLKIVQGENIDVIKAELPSVMKEKLAGAIISAIESKNISIRGEPASLENSVKIDSRHIPFRRVKNIRELMYDEMDPVFNFPGLVNAWTMPIKTRIDMLATGIKTPIGIKILGPDLKKLEELAIKVEAIVKRDPGTLSAIAERVMGGNYLDFEIKRKECARYGLTIDEVQDVIQSAIGGMNVSQTVEGLYRFNINVRYPREMRDNPESLKRILIPTPTGQQIPITQVADIVIKTGPPAIKSENAMRQAIVYVDLKGGQDVGSYVNRVKPMVDKEIKLPAGYYLNWSGQYEYMQAVRKQLLFSGIVVLILILILIYFSIKNIADTIIIVITLSFALVGGFWFVYLFDFNTSVAVWVGFIALGGLAAETSIIMHVYLDISYEKRLKGGQPMTKELIHEGIIEGAVLRVRPKMMTVMTTILALVPIMWMTGAGSQPMMRIAAPMIGGLITSTVHTLLLIPAYYAIVKEVELKLKKK